MTERILKVINTIGGVAYDMDDWNREVYDLIIQTHELAEVMPGVNSITLEVQDEVGKVHTIKFEKDKESVIIKPEGMEMKILN